jgi:hypothetical protein
MIGSAHSTSSFADVASYLLRGKLKLDPSQRVDWIQVHNLPGAGAPPSPADLRADSFGEPPPPLDELEDAPAEDLEDPDLLPDSLDRLPDDPVDPVELDQDLFSEPPEDSPDVEDFKGPEPGDPDFLPDLPVLDVPDFPSRLPTEEPDIEAAAVVMQATADQRPRVEKPVYHLKISFHPKDHPTRSEMQLVASRLLRDLGLDEHQSIIVGHKDKPHLHMHLLVNRVHPRTFEPWDRYRDWFKIERSLRGLEQELGFRLTPGTLYELPDVPAPNPALARTTAEIQRYRRTGQRPFVDVLRDEGIPQLLREANSWRELEEELAARGLYLKKAGRGLHVTDGENVAKASGLDRGSSLAKLEQRFGESWTDHRAAHARHPALSDTPARTTLRQDLAAARRELPRGGSLPQLEEQLSRLLARPLPDLDGIYRDPDNAIEELRTSLSANGPVDTYRTLRDRPQDFGDLSGRVFLRRANAQRADALRQANETGQQYLDHHLEIRRTQGAVHRAQRYQRRSASLSAPDVSRRDPVEVLLLEARRFLDELPQSVRQRLFEMNPRTTNARNLRLPPQVPSKALRVLRSAAGVLTDPTNSIQDEALPLRRALARATTVRGSSSLAQSARLMIRLLRSAPFIVSNPAGATVLLSVRLASNVLRLPIQVLERTERPSQKL